MNDLRIVFMGTPDFAVGVLKTLVENNANIVGVITAPDKPAGRGRKLRASAVKEYSEEQGLTVLQPKNLKSEAFIEELEALNANLQIVVAFRMLPKVVWAMPEYGTFNLHASLLPEYRGAAPINWAIINGEERSGVTTFFIDEKIDTGAIIAKRDIELDARETAGTLHDKLMVLGSELVLDTVELIARGEVETTVQSASEKLKEAPKLNNENTRIDWNQPAKVIDAHIRGLDPYPGAWSDMKNASEEIQLKIYGCNYRLEEHELEPGTILTDRKHIDVAASDGFIEVIEIKLPGKRKMTSRDLLNGYTFEKGAKLL